MHPVDEAIEHLAASQHSRFTRDQVREVAANPRSILHSRLRSGRWRRLTSRVLCMPAAPVGRVPDLWTAYLHVGPDVVIGRGSAAYLHGLPGVPWVSPVLLVPNGSNRRSPVATIHQLTDLVEHHVTVLDGLPVTTVERTLVDLSIAGASVALVAAWLDHLATGRALKIDRLIAVAEELRRPGKVRPTSLVTALGKRLPGKGVEQSKLERALTAALMNAGTGPGRAQHPHPGRPDSLELVDRAFPEAKLIVEADGRVWHTREMAFDSDRRRDREAAVAGWQTVRYTHTDLTSAADQVASELAEIHSTRLGLLARHSVAE